MALEDSVFNKEFTSSLNDKKILDLGCGTGRHTSKFIELNAKVTGVDFSTNMLKKAKENNRSKNVRFIQHDISKRLPFKNKYFDIVSCSLVLEHIKKLDEAFSEMKRVCKQDGYIFITEMHPDMRLKGKQASFCDSKGKRYYPKSYPHKLDDFKYHIKASQLKIAKLKAYRGTKALAKQTERAVQYIGYPMLLEFKLIPVET